MTAVRATMYLRPRAAATRPTPAASSKFALCGNCCAPPSARAPLPECPLHPCHLHAGSPLLAAVPVEKTLSTPRILPATSRVALSIDPTRPGQRSQTQPGSSQHCVPDRAASGCECGAAHSPSSSSCGKRVVRSSEEIPRLAGRLIPRKYLLHTPVDQRAHLCREAFPSVRAVTWVNECSKKSVIRRKLALNLPCYAYSCHPELCTFSRQAHCKGSIPEKGNHPSPPSGEAGEFTARQNTCPPKSSDDAVRARQSCRPELSRSLRSGWPRPAASMPSHPDCAAESESRAVPQCNPQ